LLISVQVLLVQAGAVNYASPSDAYRRNWPDIFILPDLQKVSPTVISFMCLIKAYSRDTPWIKYLVR
jgi:hypothetical protein